MSSFEIISDYSKANLIEIPEKILEMVNLKMLFLERNFLVKLPENFFYRLPNLMWLDLRNNQLGEIPKSIAHHEHLEHLLLTNNNLRKLPNELGLLFNLKALQVTDNPLIYPPKKIIQEGTKAIKNYLKEQFEDDCAKNAENQQLAIEDQEQFKNQLFERQKVLEMQEEKLIRVHEKDSSLNPSKISNNSDNFYSAHKPKSKDSISTRLINKQIENIHKKLADPHRLNPTLRVKKIDYPNNNNNNNNRNNKSEEPLKIIHNVNKSESKISLKSYFQTPTIRSNLDRIPENVLKEGWLNKLRILLNDQERILQQERNLRALFAWRQRNPSSTPKTFIDDSATRMSAAPYATYPEYAKIPSRTELAAQLETFLKDSDGINSKARIQKSQINLDKVINDLVEQLKEMEINRYKTGTPRSEIEHANKQIKTIVDIHKKLLKLKTSNEFY